MRHVGVALLDETGVILSFEKHPYHILFILAPPITVHHRALDNHMIHVTQLLIMAGGSTTYPRPTLSQPFDDPWNFLLLPAFVFLLPLAKPLEGLRFRL